ncbi:hypothetical protein B296_00033404, partial [Ensete ventricosum]
DALPLFPHPHYVTVATPTQVAVALARRRQLPYQGVATGAAPYGLATPAGAALQATVPAGGCSPYGLAIAGRTLCKGPWSQPVAPLQGALATAGCPLAGG